MKFEMEIRSPHIHKRRVNHKVCLSLKYEESEEYINTYH